MKTRNSSISKIALRTTAVLLAAALALFILADMRLAGKPIARLVSGETSFKDFTTEVHDALVSGTVGKYAFVNLNGLYCKLTGRSICNQVMLLSNGMLTNLNPEKEDMRPAADAISALAAFSEDEGAQFLYVLSPAKMDAENALLIPGESDHSNENGDELLSMLRAAGVDTLDLREALARTPEQIEQYFFRTDHHWNFTGAFEAYRILTAQLAERFPAANIDLSRADIANWEAHTLRSWMLGSQGKRTGIYFGGTDDITYYTPRFAAESSCDIPAYSGGSAYYEGSFEDANLRTDEYLRSRPDYFTSSPYDMYIGGEYALVRHRSDSAPSALRVVIVKDSFVIPVQAFLSTQFQYIDVLDPRYESAETVAEHICAVQPDVVIVMLSAQSAGSYEEYTDFGVDVPAD